MRIPDHLLTSTSLPPGRHCLPKRGPRASPNDQTTVPKQKMPRCMEEDKVEEAVTSGP